MNSQLQKLRDRNIVEAKAACKDAVRKEHYISAAIEAIKTMEQTLNYLVNRCRLWYALYDPETEHTIQNNEELMALVAKDKKKMVSMMGADLSKVDREPIIQLAWHIGQLYKENETLELYVEKTVLSLAPNTAAVAEPKIAAALIAHAGSLKNLAFLPASTIQILGAEQAFFRFKQQHGRCPKHGVLIHHPFVVKAKIHDKGKKARSLAAAISKAAKMDYFGKDEYYGYKLREKLEMKQ